MFAMNSLSILITYGLISSIVYGLTPTVEIESGKLLGTTYTLPNGRVVDAFYGIPFAAPPIGHNRFEPPRPVKSWSGFRNASFNRSPCVQFKPNLLEIAQNNNEDCLHLNVFTPKVPTSKEKDFQLLNVMVNVHGGGFFAGIGTNTKPDYILQSDDIVFVSFNYRVGILGFFHSNDLVAPGNNGLKDQVAALKWVRENIRQFGGDPDKVTIYGSSGGGGCVHFHLISSLSRGLYQNAISSSGSVLHPWSIKAWDTNRNCLAVASLLNCPVGDSRRLLRCLKTKSIESIFAASRNLTGDSGLKLLFGPVVEPKHRLAFLSTHPMRLLQNKKVRNMPWMISVTEDEGSFAGINTGIVTNETKLKYLNDNWNEEAPKLFLFDYIRSESQRDYVSSEVRRFYFNDKDISNETANQLLQALGDRWFYNGITENTKLHAAAIDENVYCYKFRYRGSESFCSDKLVIKKFGTCHADDIFYLMRLHQKKLNHNKIDEDVIKFMVSSVIAFMKNGDPNTGIEDWKPVKKNGTTMDCLNIYSSKLQKMENIENWRSVRFWRSVLPMKNEWNL